MIDFALCEELAYKHNIPIDAVEELASELEKNGGLSIRFDIEDLGGKGIWKQGQPASVGNGFDAELNYIVTDLCSRLSESIRGAADQDDENESTRSFDDTIGLMPISLMPNAWWPDQYGIVPDILGNAGTMRYAYFEHCNRLVIRQNLRNRVYDTTGYTVIKLIPGEKLGFSHLLIKTETGNVALDELREVAE